MPMRARPLAGACRAVLALVIVALTVIGSAGIAHAHAVVTSSDPADGERLSAPPTSVTIQFSEGISSDLGGLKVLDAKGQRVDQNDASQPSPTSLRVSLPDGLADGTYVANYKIVSADGHPVSGAIVFGVGNASLSDVSKLAENADPTFEVTSKVGQFVTYVGALLAAGLAFFITFLHDGGSDRARLVSVAKGSTLFAAAGAAVTILSQAALATGQGPGAAFQSGVIGPLLRQGLGWSTAALLVGLALCHVALDLRRSVTAQAFAFYGGLAVTSSFVLWGHATESPRAAIAIPADIVHVAMAGVWFGGLVGLALVLRARARPAFARARQAELRDGLPPGAATATPATAPEDDHAVALVGASVGAATSTVEAAADEGPTPGPSGADAPPDDHPGAPGNTETPDTDPTAEPGSLTATVRIVQRFSTTAAVSVVLLTVAGLGLSYAELGSLGALTSTSYGTVLLVKLGLVAVVLFLAAYNRFLLLPWLLHPAGGQSATGPAAPDDGEHTPDGDGGEPDGGPVLAAGADAHPGRLALADDMADDADPVDDLADVDDDERAGWRTLLRTVAVEGLGIVAALAVTAVLVNTTPGITAVAPTGGPFQESKEFRDGQVTLTITPNKPGRNSVHVDFTDKDGKLTDPAQKVTLEMRLPAQDLGPITREMVKAGKGHFLLENISDLSIPGDWQISLLVRVSDFDQQRVTFQDTVT